MQSEEKAKRVTHYPLISVKVSDLIFDKENPNFVSPNELDAMWNSFKTFGNLVPITIDQNNFIVAGNHRAEIYKEMKLEEIPAIRREFKDDDERRLCSQVLNKLHGKYENVKDANQLTILLQHDRLDELAELLAKKKPELGKIIMEHSTTANKELLDALCGEDSDLRGTGSLAKKFGVPPFSILDTTSEAWRNRKALWLAWGLRSEQGREFVRYYNPRLSKNLPTVSIFDPVLAEIGYRWFAPKQQCKVLDPFAGGSVRGIVASFLGHEYHGVDLRQEQIDANEQQWKRLEKKIPVRETPAIKPKWYVGDSLNIDEIIPAQSEEFDMLLTSPPYFQQEHYSDLDEDLNNMSLAQFVAVYSAIIGKCCNLLKKEGSFVVWNTSNTRDPKSGKIINITHKIIDEFEKYGFFLLNDLILVRAVMMLQVMAPKHFINKRFAGSRHENVLVFFRGEDKETIPKLDINVVYIPETQGEKDEDDLS